MCVRGVTVSMQRVAHICDGDPIRCTGHACNNNSKGGFFVEFHMTLRTWVVLYLVAVGRCSCVLMVTGTCVDCRARPVMS